MASIDLKKGKRGVELIDMVVNNVESVLSFFFFQAEDGIRDRACDWSSDVCSSDLDNDNEHLKKELLRAIKLLSEH